MGTAGSRIVLVVLGIGVLTWALAAAAQPPAPPPPPVPPAAIGEAQGESEVLTRGPIHEAFAAPVNTGGVKPLVVPKEPPQPIEELPPDSKPADESAIWINGYWSWDDDRSDFLWISGVWRVPPPGNTWVAGYWNKVAGGFQWVPGFWSPAETAQTQYLPEPPASQEQGPSSPSPGANYFWIPGAWQWRLGRFVWQPGYWAPVQPDWIWVPACYVWSPSGWIYVEGYWDYPLVRRGLIFCPVRFHRPLWLRPGFVYSPSVVVNFDCLTFHLFARPLYGHYYFGDYYDRMYVGMGIYPWFAVHGLHHGYRYDPLFSYYNWHHVRTDPHWLTNIQGWHRHYVAHPDLRPAHTLAGVQIALSKSGSRADKEFLHLAQPLSKVGQGGRFPVPLSTVSAQQKLLLQKDIKGLQNLTRQRQQLEVGALNRTGKGSSASPIQAHQLTLPKNLNLGGASGMKTLSGGTGAGSTSGGASGLPGQIKLPSGAMRKVPTKPSQQLAPKHLNLPGGLQTLGSGSGATGSGGTTGAGSTGASKGSLPIKRGTNLGIGTGAGTGGTGTGGTGSGTTWSGATGAAKGTLPIIKGSNLGIGTGSGGTGGATGAGSGSGGSGSAGAAGSSSGGASKGTLPIMRGTKLGTGGGAGAGTSSGSSGGATKSSSPRSRGKGKP